MRGWRAGASARQEEDDREGYAGRGLPIQCTSECAPLSIADISIARSGHRARVFSIATLSVGATSSYQR